MSIYQHQHMYGQPRPNFPSAPPPQGGYYYQQPHQPTHPFPSLDAASVRRQFSMRISQLNLNSRQMIQDLSSLAFQFAHFSDVVAQCIRSHILKVSEHFLSYDGNLNSVTLVLYYGLHVKNLYISEFLKRCVR